MLAFRIAGSAVAIGLIAVSVLMNFRFGQLLGKTEWDGLIYGLTGACADGLKTLLPFVIAGAWTTRRIGSATAAALLFVIFTAYSVTSGLGLAAINRSELAGGRSHATTQYQVIRDQLDARRRERQALTGFRPTGAIAAELRQIETQPLWLTSKGCTEISARQMRVLCDRHAALQGERATAERARVLDEQVATLADRLAAQSAASAGSTADPQISILKELSGLAEDRVQLALAMLLALMVEVGSGLGLFLVLQHGRPRETTPLFNASGSQSLKDHRIEPARLKDWLAARTAANASARTAEIELYRDYCIWAVAEDRGVALPLSAFHAQLAPLIGGAIIRHGRRSYVEGVALRSVPAR